MTIFFKSLQTYIQYKKNKTETKSCKTYFAFEKNLPLRTVCSLSITSNTEIILMQELITSSMLAQSAKQLNSLSWYTFLNGKIIFLLPTHLRYFRGSLIESHF